MKYYIDEWFLEFKIHLIKDPSKHADVRHVAFNANYISHLSLVRVFLKP